MNGRDLALASAAGLAGMALARCAMRGSAARGGLNRVARVEGSLWIGTTRQNLAGILAHGIQPSGGYSVHRTKTRGAVFLAGDPEAALLYADSASGSRTSSANAPYDPVLLEIDAHGLVLRPDYDDLSADIQAYLGELSDEVGEDVEPGVPLGDREDAVLDAIEQVEERREHGGIRAEVEDDGEDRVLALVPIHDLPVDSRAYRADPDLYEELGWRDGDPRLETTQYQHAGPLPARQVRAIYLLARGPRKADLVLPSYGYLTWPPRYEDPESAIEAGADVCFLKRRFHRRTLVEARQLLGVKP